MKLIQINAVNGIGSTGRTCQELENHFIKSKDVKIITLYASGFHSPNSVKIASKVEQSIHGLLSRLTGLQGYFSPIATRKVIRIIRNEKPDAIIINNTHSNYVNIIDLIRFIGKEKIPLIVHLDDCWYYTGKCTHYYQANCYQWKNCCGNCPRLKKDIPSWLFDKTSKMLKDKQMAFSTISKLSVIGVSDWIVHEAEESYFGQCAKIIRRIYNWIDFDIFKPADKYMAREKHNIPKDIFVILGVASIWSEKKGLDIFLSLSKLLAPDEIIILIGSLPNIDMPNNIKILDRTDNTNTLVEFYSLSDVFVQASIEESFGKVVAESLACGTPVVSNRHTANPELLWDGCGLIVENDNVTAYLNAIRAIKNNGKQYYSRNCVMSAHDRFNKETLITDTINTVNETINL